MGLFKRRKDDKGRGIGIGLADHGRKSPMRAAEQDAPASERPTRVDEETGTAVHEMKEPPQAEGDR